MDKDKHLEASSLGGKNKNANTSRKGADQTQESPRNSVLRMEDLLDDLEKADDELQK